MARKIKNPLFIDMQNDIDAIQDEMKSVLDSIAVFNEDGRPDKYRYAFKVSCAASVDNIYTAIEKIFSHIAYNIDGVQPKHQAHKNELATRMSKEIPGIRPAVISPSIANHFYELKEFVDFWRDNYSNKLTDDLLEDAIGKAKALSLEIVNEIEDFEENFSIYPNESKSDSVKSM